MPFTSSTPSPIWLTSSELERIVTFFILNAPLIYAHAPIFASFISVVFFMTASSSIIPNVSSVLGYSASVITFSRSIRTLSSL